MYNHKIYPIAAIFIIALAGCSSNENASSIQDMDIDDASVQDLGIDDSPVQGIDIDDASDQDMDVDDTSNNDANSSGSEQQLGLPYITSETYTDALDTAFELLNFEPMEDALSSTVLDRTTLQSTMSLVAGITDPGNALTVFDEPGDSWGFYQDFSCDAGGSIRSLLPSDRNTTELGSQFNDCMLVDGVYNGLSRYKSPNPRDFGSRHMFNDYRVEDFNGNSFSISGTYSVNSTMAGDSASARWQDVNFIRTVNGRSFQVDDYSSSYSMNDSSSNGGVSTIEYRRDASFTYHVEDTSVNVVSDLRAGRFGPSPDTSSNLWWTTGSIVISANDGSSLIMEPVAGNRQVWNVLVMGPLTSEFQTEVGNPIKCLGLGELDDYEHSELCD